jgi:hypothetical protein
MGMLGPYGVLLVAASFASVITVRGRAGRLRGVSARRSESIFVRRFFMGAQGS